MGMKKWIIAAVLVGVGIVLAFPLFSMAYYTMVRTPTPEFCAPAMKSNRRWWPGGLPPMLTIPMGLWPTAWTATGTWFTTNQVTIMYKQYRKLPYQAKGLRSL
jgi:hypothetical protein